MAQTSLPDAEMAANSVAALFLLRAKTCPNGTAGERLPVPRKRTWLEFGRPVHLTSRARTSGSGISKGCFGGLAAGRVNRFGLPLRQ